MKRTYTLPVGMLLGIAAFAQPVIDLSQIPPPTSDLQRVVFHFDQEPVLATGADQVWDITGTMSSTHPGWFMPPNIFAGGIDVQDATVMWQYMPQFPWDMPYYRSDATGYAHISTYKFTADDAEYYTDPIQFMVYPCTHGTSWTDYYTLTDQVGFIVEEGGPLDYLADGYGTLITNFGTFHEVLKVSNAFESGVPGNSYHTEINHFWKQGVPWWLAKVIVTRHYVDGELEGTTHGAEVLNLLSTGVAATALDAGPLLYPNPAHEQVTVRSPFAGRTTITVQDALGRTVRTLSSTVSQRTLELTGLASGSYMVRLVGEHGQQEVGNLVVN